MRAFVAILTVAVCRGSAHARDSPQNDFVPRELLSALGVAGTPIERLVACGHSLGPAKCITALSAWRAENALNTLAEERNARFNLSADAERFPWTEYTNNTDEQLYENLCDSTEKLLRYRSLKFDMIPGYSFELHSKRNKTLNVEIYSNDVHSESGRSTVKKFRKQFYRILPILLIPGLIMSAILPFVLPALKMMVVAVGMLNNMALTGAIFTLLRNNAFSDYNHKKIVYVNDGYRNKERYPTEHIDETQHHETLHNFDDVYVGDPGFVDHVPAAGDDIINIEEYPNQVAWVNQFFEGKDTFVNVVAQKNRGSIKKHKNR